MASIKINDLRPTGSELFHDSETFLNELTEEELGVQGGLASVTISLTYSWSVSWTFTWSFAAQA